MPDSNASPRHLNRIKLRDASACPGLELMERIAFRRNPRDEDMAILEAWHLLLPVTVVPAGTYV